MDKCQHEWWAFGQADRLVLLVCTKCLEIGTQDASRLLSLTRTGHLFPKLQRWNGDPDTVTIRKLREF